MFTTIASRLTRRSTLPVIYHGQHQHRYTYQRFDRFANLRAFSSESLAAAAAADDNNFDVSAQSINQDDTPTQNTSLPQIPIATFIDLDNVGPKTFSRKDAISFISPLLQLGRLINDTNSSDTSGERLENILKMTQEGGDTKKKSKLSSSPALVVRRLLKSLDVHIEAFGNLATRSYRSEQEQERTIDDQEYIKAEEFDDGMIIAQTGYDEEGKLRCGVCGSVMKLSKKDRKAGKTLESKLRQHMKIHDREQNKRKTRMKQGKKKKKLSAKEMKKFIKYEAAQVGSKRSNMKATKSGKMKKSPNTKNDLFRVIREVGVKVKPADNVDAKLVTSAQQWMNKISERQNRDGKFLHYWEKNGGYRGILVVFSKDSDFLKLLQQAKEKKFLTISMTDERIQTSKLVRECDVVIGPFIYDTDWIDSSNSARGSSSNLASLISEDDDSMEEDEVVRNVGRAPLPSLISSTTAKSLSKDVPMQAISRSAEGYEFMIERRRQAQDGFSEEDNTVAQWDLRYGYIDRSSPTSASGAETKGESKGRDYSKQAGFTSRPKELAKQHIPWASVYKVSKGGNTKKKKTTKAT